MSHTLSVVLVHRDPAERALLRAAFESAGAVQIAGERPDLRGGLALARQVRPDILVLELDRRGQEETLAAGAQYRMEHPDGSLFLTTDQVDSDILLRAIRAGAQDVLRRPFDRSALGAAIERVAGLKARKFWRFGEARLSWRPLQDFDADVTARQIFNPLAALLKRLADGGPDGKPGIFTGFHVGFIKTKRQRGPFTSGDYGGKQI